MMTQLRRSQPRLLPTVSTRRRKRRVIAWGAVVLTCIGGIAVGPEAVRIGTPALAQATSGIPSPPADAPVMVPGQRVRRSYGWLEIMTFDRSERDQDSVFRVEFRVRNESSSEINFSGQGQFRLIVDGVPRSPAESSDRLNVEAESAEDGYVTFRVGGKPRVVHVQVGTGDSGRSFLRWPD